MGFTRRSLEIALALLLTNSARADDEPIRIRPRPQAGTGLAAVTDTVSVGFLATSSDPNKVHVGGVWDFDTPAYAPDISGTDSSQFWTFLRAPGAVDASYFPTPEGRPFWYYDWGNNINAGDHNLWMSRVGQRVFRRTGLAGVWHVDDLSTVPDTGTVSPGFSHNITGSGSAWCGLRLNGDPNAPHDPYTGNAYTSDIQFNDFRANPGTHSDYPGYAGQWDQLLYRDFAYDSGSPGTVSFAYRAELDDALMEDFNGSGWFTPDPFSSSNFVSGIATTQPRDSFEVWVGAPREMGIYDPAHRYLSDTIDFGQGGADAPRMIFGLTGVSSGSASPAIPAGASWTTVRVVLRVKTNRSFDDRIPSGGGSGWNSTTGAIVIDNLNVNGTVSDFESASQILPRFTWTPLGGADASVTENLPSGSWITTGREPARYGHVDNLGSLPFGVIGGACNMADNVALQSNHDDPNHDFVGESQNYMISPTICLTGSRAADQGIPPTLRSEASYMKIVFDFYTGFDDPQETGSLFQYVVRFMGTGPTSLQRQGPKQPAWDPFCTFNGELCCYGDSLCLTLDSGNDLAPFVPLASTDSIQIAFQNQLRCTRFGSPQCGQSDGYYFDNIQVQFVRDQPFTGIEPVGPSLDFVRGAYPNPSADGSATVLFSLRSGAPVIVRFYDLRGALVHEARIDGRAGENRYRWSGLGDRGASVSSGIFFYRLFADGVEFRNNQQRVVFVGQREN